MLKKLRRKFIAITMSLVTAVLLAVFVTMCVTQYTTLRDDVNVALNQAMYIQVGFEIRPVITATTAGNTTTVFVRSGEVAERLTLAEGMPESTVFFAVQSAEDEAVQGEATPVSGWTGAIRPEAVESLSLTRHRAAVQIPTFWVTVSADGDITTSRNSVSISDDELAVVVRHALDAESEMGNIPEYSLRYMKRTEPGGDIRIAYADRTSEINGMQTVIINSLLVGIPALVALFIISLFLSSRAIEPVSDAWNRQRRFVSDASHELKTPLTVILANMGLMLTHTEDSIADHIQLAENTRIEATRMKSLVEDLLLLAAADIRPDAPKPEHTSISDLCWNTVLSFEPVAFEQGVSIRCDIAPDLSAVTDASAVSQIITILLDNAVKYAGADGCVDVRLHAALARPELVVSNTGEGIAPEHLPHIFERFYRADQSRSEGGFGLGLAIAAELCELNGYKISANSEGEGATFTVRF